MYCLWYSFQSLGQKLCARFRTFFCMQWTRNLFVTQILICTKYLMPQNSDFFFLFFFLYSRQFLIFTDKASGNDFIQIKCNYLAISYFRLRQIKIFEFQNISEYWFLCFLYVQNAIKKKFRFNSSFKNFSIILFASKCFACDFYFCFIHLFLRGSKYIQTNLQNFNMNP